MTLRAIHPTGRAYLELVSGLLQRARLAEPEGGLWEAADLQWWWLVDQHPDPASQTVWMDGDTPVVAVVFTRWRDWIGCDLLGTDAAVAEHSASLWADVADRFTADVVSMSIRDDDDVQIAAAERAGFIVEPGTYATAWMDAASWLDAADSTAAPPAPSGFRIVSYDAGTHPMVRRSGAQVGQRLAECPLYRPELDLAVHDGDVVAGYALFWADPVTRVGLLEPMRIEDAYQGRGLSKALIAEGLARMATAGCTRFKVTFDPANEPAARLYTGAGYRLRTTARTWTRSPAAPD